MFRTSVGFDFILLCCELWRNNFNSHGILAPGIYFYCTLLTEIGFESPSLTMLFETRLPIRHMLIAKKCLGILALPCIMTLLKHQRIYSTF
jgi:hypothetical protein